MRRLAIAAALAAAAITPTPALAAPSLQHQIRTLTHRINMLERTLSRLDTTVSCLAVGGVSFDQALSTSSSASFADGALSWLPVRVNVLRPEHQYPQFYILVVDPACVPDPQPPVAQQHLRWRVWPWSAPR